MEEWERIDDLISRGVVITAIKEIRDLRGCRLGEAIELYHERAAQLSGAAASRSGRSADERSVGE
ncbi:hypothetical protein [Couchioplanes azureus]|uniref:hypothetical protein n=1 Tax=Couchioplanes caeruleus TaxID=56438 RepID=UPI00166FD0EB|nr:hypothetical protein [Couchioplanes caeruleus]